MASRRIRIPVKVTVKRQMQVRATSQVRSYRTVQGSSSQSFGRAAWVGPPGDRISNHFGDVNTISGDGNQVAIGTTGDVIQIGAGRDVDTDKLRATIRELLAVLPSLPVADDERDGIQSDAGALLDEIDSGESDEDRQRRLGASISEKLIAVGTAAAGGGIAQVLGKALLVALGLS